MVIEPITTNNNQQQQNFSGNVTMNEIQFKANLNKVAEDRPIEEDTDNSTETTTETIIDDNKVLVFTRYDDEGNAVNVVPPGYVAKV
jgi:hypothetical protein